MRSTHRLHRQTAALTMAIAVVAASCGGSDDSTTADDTAAVADSSSTEASSPPPTDPMPTEPSPTEPPSTTEGSSVASPDCPPPVEPPTIEPVEAGVDAFPPYDGLQTTLPAGRYTTSTLGISLALDLPTDDFAIPDQFAGTVVATDNPGGLIAFVRGDGYILSSPEPGEDVDTVDLETWLAESGVTVVADTATTVAGRDARDILVTVPPTGEEDTIPFVADWSLLSSSDVDRRFLVVDVDDPEALLITIEPTAQGDDVFAGQVEAILDSLAVGAPGPSLATVYADSPWNVGNLSGPAPAYVAAGCAVPLVAFGGTEFELAESTRIRGAGDEIFLIDPEVPYEGVVPPTIQLVAPEFTADGNGIGEPGITPTAVATIDDVVAEMTADGYTLTSIETDATLLGSPVTAFDFVGPEELPSLWLPRSHAASAANPSVGEEPFRSGTVYIAETGVGVLVAMLEGETGTGDVDLMRDRFDLTVATLRET